MIFLEMIFLERIILMTKKKEDDQAFFEMQREMQEEAHYHAVLASVCELMKEHGNQQVLLDLFELALIEPKIKTELN